MAKESDPDHWLCQYYTDEKEFTPEDGAFDLSLTPEAQGKYTVEGQIGCGGMKCVHRVQDRDTGRSLAMATPLGGDGGRFLRFVREARITASLEHPNIIPVHDIGVSADGKPYFTMKLLEGESVGDILRQLAQGSKTYSRRYPLLRLLEIYQRICDAMAYAHSRGVIHRDLKPSNIVIGRYGEIHIIDWGLAKNINDLEEPEGEALDALLTRRIGETLDGMIKGSPGFMSPEQVDQRIQDIGVTTDVYALGSLLYAILTLKAPVTGKSLRTIVEKTIAGRILPPAQRTPGRSIPGALSAISMKALKRKATDRYQSVDELQEDLRAFLGGYATRAEEAGLWTLARLLIRRQKWLVGVISLCFLAVAAVSTEAVYRIRKSQLRAEGALAAMRNEESLRRQAASRALPGLQKQLQADLKRGDYAAASRTIDLTLALAEKDRLSWIQRGALFLGQGNLRKGIDAFEHARPLPGQSSPDYRYAMEVLLPFCIHHRDAEDVPSREWLNLLENQVFSKELIRSKGRLPQLVFGALLHWRTMEPTEENGHLATAVLRAFNPKVKGFSVQLESDRGGWRCQVHAESAGADLTCLSLLPIVDLDLSGVPLRSLGFVAGMKLKRLNISGTSLRSFSVLESLPLEQLNLSGCKVRSVQFLLRLRHLKQVTVGPNDNRLFANIRAALPGNVEVIQGKDRSVEK